VNFPVSVAVLNVSLLRLSSE